MSQVSSGIVGRIVAQLLILSAVMHPVGRGGIASAQSTALVVSAVSLSGSNLIVSGSGALSGATYYVVASTDLTLAPVPLWNKISTNTFPADGAFTNSILVDLTIPQEFFAIDMPLTYTISTSSSPTNGGSTAGGGTVAAGSNVTVCATANACYGFVNWTDQNSNVLSATACYNFTAVTNLTLVANFALTTYTINTSSSPVGGGSTSGGGTVNCGSNVTVCATTNTCYGFVNWTDQNSNVVSTTACYSFTASTNRTLVANFVPLTYTINTSSSPAGGGSTSGGGTVNCGSNVTVCATTNACYGFVNWTDQNSNVLSGTACYSFTATTNRTLVANFAPLTYTIGTSSSPVGGGTTSGGGTVNCGSNVTVCATTNACYGFVNWIDQNSNVVSTTACYSFTASTNRTLVANFAPLTYTISTSSSPVGGGTTSGGGTVNCGSNVTVCATANASYSFVNWTDQNSNVLSVTACYSFTATTNRNLVANFTLSGQVTPTSPGNLIATGVSSNQINLSWLSATDSVGGVTYLLERQGPGSTNFVQIGTPAGTSYTDTGLTANTNYSYRVRGKDAAQNLGPYSNVAGATTLPRLVAAYAFDEGSGTTVTDLSGNGNTGTISGATWTNAGKYGNALVFNGTSAWVTIKDSASVDLTTGMTLEAWVNLSQVGNMWQDVIYKGPNDYYLEATSSPYIVPAVGGTFGGANPNVLGTTVLTTNTWIHLALTYDGATLLLYVNGVEVGGTAQTGNIQTSTNPLQLGGDNIYGQYFQGVMDEVRIYNVALTQSQIQSDMNIPLGNIPSAPGNLTATPMGTNQVNLLWTAATDNLGVTGYLVERQGPGSTNFVQIGTPAGTSYSDTNLTANGYCSYRVRATDGSGHLGPYSNVAQTYMGLSISPRVAALTVTRTQQFTTSYASTNFVWAVDGVVGGAGTSGTITAAGLYSPPTTAGTHTVTVSDQTRSATATVYVSVYPGTYTYHNDNLRTGQNLNETALTPTNVNATTFGKLFSYALDGITFASPLYVANVSIPGQGFHNLVFAATEHDSVYAFDADGLTNSPLWQVSFINPGAGVTTIPCNDIGGCDDIPNEFGITSTPVIDPTNGTLYVVAATKENTTNYVQRLHALDIATGAEKFGGPVVIQGSVAGTGPGSVGGHVSFVPLQENQRTGLLLANGVVYFGFSSHGDVEPYYGWVMGYSATNLQQQTLIFNDAPNANKAGVWMDGDGIACDATGNVFFISGDGTFNASSGGKDYGDCFLKINPAGTVLDYFSPSVQTTLDQNNMDLGSGGGLLLPDQSGAHPHEMVSAGKNGTIYLVDRDNMGHYHSNSDQIVQSLVNIFYNNSGDEGGNFSSPVYFNGSVYFAPVLNNLNAFQLSSGLLSTSPTSLSADTYSQRGGTMAISANGTANGILWTLQSTGTLTYPGVLHAYNPANVSNEFYNSNQAGTRDTLDAWWKFSVPLVANGKVFVTSMNQLTVYGLLP